MAKETPVKLAYFAFEPEGGVDEDLSPVLFLHGITGCKENWDKIPQRVADATKRKTYSLDSRNHGDSEYTDDFTFELNVCDLFHFMDIRKIPKAILVGHSMGAVTAMRAALKEPERVEMIVSVDMYAKRISQKMATQVLELITLRNAMIEDVPGNLSESDIVKSLLDYMFNSLPEELHMVKKTDDIYDMKLGLKRNEDGSFRVSYNKEVIEGALRNMEAFSKPSGQYMGPAHFIYGECSRFSVGSKEDNIKRHFPTAEFYPFEEATHYLHMEYPKQFTETLVRLIPSK